MLSGVGLASKERGGALTVAMAQRFYHSKRHSVRKNKVARGRKAARELQIWDWETSLSILAKPMAALKNFTPA